MSIQIILKLLKSYTVGDLYLVPIQTLFQVKTLREVQRGASAVAHFKLASYYTYVYRTRYLPMPLCWPLSKFLHKSCPDAASSLFLLRWKKFCKAWGYLNNSKKLKKRKPVFAKRKQFLNYIYVCLHFVYIYVGSALLRLSRKQTFWVYFCPHWKSIPWSIFTQIWSSALKLFTNLSATEFSHQISEFLQCPELATRYKSFNTDQGDRNPLPDCTHCI